MEKRYLAIVTGGAQGIGFAITEALLKAGGKVHFLDISDEAGLKAQKELNQKYGGRAKFVQCDVSKKDQLEKTFYQSKEELGGLNVICNNAGISPVALERALWDEMIAINMGATIHGCLLGLDLMDTGKSGSGGVIINTASIAGLPPLLPAGTIYSATKAGVIHFTRRVALACLGNKPAVQVITNPLISPNYTDSIDVLRMEVLKRPKTSMAKGIRINCICPSYVNTKMFADGMKEAREMKLLETEIPFTEEYALAIALAPSEVADEVVKLIEDETKNGEALVIAKDKGVYFHKFSS